MRFGNFGCKTHGIPHDLKIVYENKSKKIEVCQLCNKMFRWNKGFKGRVNNVEYLKAHIRNFAQKFGATKRVYHKIYNPEKTVIYV